MSDAGRSGAKRARSRSSAAAAAIPLRSPKRSSGARPARRAVSAARLRPIRRRSSAIAHHWLDVGQVGRFSRLARAEAAATWCSSASLVRPPLSAAAARLGDLALLPRSSRAYRGGDDHLLPASARIFEEHGFPHRRRARGRAGNPDAAKARSAASRRRSATAPTSRAACVTCTRSGRSISGRPSSSPDNHVLAVEAAEGTDAMLSASPSCARSGRIAAPAGTGVLVKAPKPGRTGASICRRSARRPSRGRRAPGLPASPWSRASTIIAEPAAVAAAADRANIFVVGIGPSDASAMTCGAPQVFLVAGEESGDRLGARADARAAARAHGASRFAGVGGRAMAAQGLASLFPHRRLAIIGFASIPRRLPTILRRIRETADAVDRGATRTCWSSSTARISPIASRAACAAPRRTSRSSIMSRPRSGRGGRGARARCAPTSTKCWRCCRSSRRRSRGLAARPAPMSAIRWPNGSASCGPNAEERAPALARSAGAAGAAGQPRQRDPPPGGDFRRGASRKVAERAGPFDVVPADAAAHRRRRSRAATADWPVRPRIVIEPAEKHAAFRSARAALAASGTVTLELALAQRADGRGLSRSRLGGRSVPPAVKHQHRDPRQPRARRESRAGIPPGRLHAGPACRARSFRCSATRRSGGASSTPLRRLEPSWTCPARPQAPGPPARFSTCRGRTSALPSRRGSC